MDSKYLCFIQLSLVLNRKMKLPMNWYLYDQNDSQLKCLPSAEIENILKRRTKLKDNGRISFLLQPRLRFSSKSLQAYPLPRVSIKHRRPNTNVKT